MMNFELNTINLDLEGLLNVHNLQKSKNVDDQKRLLKLLKALSSDSGWPICASILVGSSENLPNLDLLPEEQQSALFFLCSRAVEEHLKSNTPVTSEEASKFATFVWHWLRRLIVPVCGETRPKYLEAKASQIISLSVLRYYPQYWSSIFDDLLSVVTQSSDKQTNGSSSTYVSVELLLDVLIDLDASIISRDIQLTTEELKRSNEIKDTLRASSIISLMNTCYELVNRFACTEPVNASLIKKIFETVGLYASWVDLNLVAGVQWVTLIERLLRQSANNSSNTIIRCGIYSYLVGIVNKGMAVVDKLRLLDGIWEQLGLLLLNDPTFCAFVNASETVIEELDENESECLRGLATLVDATGVQLIDVYRTLYESISPTSINCNSPENGIQDLLSVALHSVETRLNVAIRLFENKEPSISHSLIPFLRSYLGFLKSSNLSAVSISTTGRRSRNRNSSTSMDSPNSHSNITSGSTQSNYGLIELNETRVFLVKRLLFAFIEKLKFLPIQVMHYDEEDEFESYRHDLRTLIGNVIQLDPGFTLNVIHQMFERAQQIVDAVTVDLKSSFTSENMAEVDVVLNLFYLFGEVCKAPKNDHFAQTFFWHENMISIMSILCSNGFSNLPHWTLQLQYFEIMARYERYFFISPEHLFQVMLAFVDHRGLHSPWHMVRVRCAYLITRLIKAHRKTLAPHTENFLSHFSDLLQLSLEPDLSLTNGTGEGSVTDLKSRSCTKFGLGITEQGFLYEAAAQLIAAGGGIVVNEVTLEKTDSVGHLFRMLLNPVLMHLDQMVGKFAEERDPKMAEARALLLKQAIDLITRTSRVLSQPKTTVTPGCESVFLDALRLIVSELARFPTKAASPGRASACAGVRAFLHRMVACLISTNSNDSRGSASEILLTSLVDAVPHLVKPLVSSNSVIWSNGDTPSNLIDAEQRWKEIRDIIPLIIQVISRYKSQSVFFLSTCLPGLIKAIMNALNEPLPSDHLALTEERKLLRRGYLQLIQTICQSVPDAFFQILGTNLVQNLSTVLQQVDACLESDDPLGLRSGLILFLQLIQAAAHDSRFYEEFLLVHFVPFCILAPIRPSFRLSDAQFGLALNELANCLHCLSQKQDGIFVYLEKYFLPQQQLSPELIQSYLVALRSTDIKDFQQFVRRFYAAFR